MPHSIKFAELNYWVTTYTKPRLGNIFISRIECNNGLGVQIPNLFAQREIAIAPQAITRRAIENDLVTLSHIDYIHKTYNPFNKP